MADRIHAMCLRLSETEHDSLTAMAREMGMPKASVIRMLIREESARKAISMSDPEAIRKALEATFTIRRREQP